jgi:hypothetical protein
MPDRQSRKRERPLLPRTATARFSVGGDVSNFEQGIR